MESTKQLRDLLNLYFQEPIRIRRGRGGGVDKEEEELQQRKLLTLEVLRASGPPETQEEAEQEEAEEAEEAEEVEQEEQEEVEE